MPRAIQVKNKIQEDKVIKAAHFKKHVRVTVPHKHDSYFELIFLSQGSGTHYIDTTCYKVTPGALYLINHEQTHHWNLDSEPDGYVVIIKKAFLDHSIDKELKTLIYQLSKNNYLLLQDTATLSVLLELLVQEVALSTYALNSVIEGILKALFAKILQDPGCKTIEKTQSTGLCYDFMNLLRQQQNLRNSVAFYAEQLNTTPQNLNQACKKEMNATASGVLSDFILNEAKRLLTYTDMNVTEVSLSLNFNDASHFIKYFKRFTGITPQVYRANLL